MAQTQVSATTVASTTTAEQPRLSVWIKSTWAGEWTHVPYLYPERASVQAGPGIGNATFSYRYGAAISHPDVVTDTVYPPLASYMDYFVQIRTRIANAQTVWWTGVITAEDFDVLGASAGGQPEGTQTITARELGHLLDREYLLTGHYKQIDGEGYDYVELGVLPTFNLNGLGGRTLKGNRSATRATDFDEVTDPDCYAFSEDGSSWTNLNIVEYLMANKMPSAFSAVTVQVTGQTAPLAYMVDVHDFNGMTLWAVLDKLIPSSRGFGWQLLVGYDGVLSLCVYSLLGQALASGAYVMPANPCLVSFNLDTDARLDKASISIDRQTRFERFVVTGERLKTCCTLSIEDGSLEPAWTLYDDVTTDAEEYKYAMLPDMADTSDAELNDEERKRDAFERVFQLFRVPRDFDWTVWDRSQVDPAVEDKLNICPTVLQTGTVDATTAAPCSLFGKGFGRFLPFEKDADASGAEPEYRPLLALVKSDATYIQADGITDNPMAVKPGDQELSVEVSPTIGHVLGKNHIDEFYGAEVPVDSLVDPDFDYEDMLFTVLIPTDQVAHVEERTIFYSTVPSPRTLRLHVPGVELWYVVEGTVTGVADGVLVKELINYGLVRDDTAYLRAVAALAKAWYGQTRSAISATWKRIASPAPIGAYIVDASTSWQREPVGTTISEMSCDFRNGTTSIRTAYTNIDALAAARGTKGIANRVSTLEASVNSIRERIGNLSVRRARGTAAASSGGSGTLAAHSHNATTDGGAGVIDLDG